MKISIIIPTLNRPEDLRRCLASIAGNTRQPDEVIIVEQGDVKLTQQVASEYSLPIQLYYFDQKSLTRARNFGFAKTNGDIIVYIDDDVEIATDYLAVAEKYFEADSDREIVAIAGKDLVQAEVKRSVRALLRQCVGVLFWRGTFGSKNRVLVSGQNVLRNTGDTEQEAEWLSGATFCVRREVFDQGHNFEERFIRWSFGEDVMFSHKLHLAQSGSVRYVPTLQFRHNVSSAMRMHNVSLTKMMIIYRYIFWKECVQQGKWWRVLPYLWSQVGFCIIELLARPRRETVYTLISTYHYLYRHCRGILKSTSSFNLYIFDE